MIDITARGFGGKSAVALGFFDGLHLGHIEVIKRTLGREERAVVFTFNDRTMLPKFKTRQNIISYDLKLELLSKIGVDYIFAPDFLQMQDLSAEEFVDEVLIKRLGAGFVCCGYDFRFAKGGAATPEDLLRICSDRGIEAEIVPAVKIDGEAVSSTTIRRLISEGNVERANFLLGYELTYVLEVHHGNHIGKELGFPTINQIIPDGTVVPKQGVYQSWTQIKGRNYPSITNIGVKPTVEADLREPIMETHIIAFSGDLYGLRARVGLRRYMRAERRFDSLDKLKEQLALDKAEVLAFSPKPL